MLKLCLLMAAILDGVAVLLWTKTKSADGTKGRNFSVSSNTNASFKDLDRTLQLPVRCIQLPQLAR
jgi:hypothetical protein